MPKNSRSGTANGLTGAQEAALAAYASDPKKSKIAAYRASHDVSGLSKEQVLKDSRKFWATKAMKDAILNMNVVASERAGVTAGWVLAKLKLFAEFNINKFIVVKGGKAYYDFSKATDEDWYCISEYTADFVHKGHGEDLIEVEKFRIKTVDKLRALELAGKHVQVAAFQQEREASGVEELAQAFKDIAEKLPV